jgi:uncharacterized protein involved in exopolysaccharide biosynthesis
VQEKHPLLITYVATVVNRHKKPMAAVFVAIIALVSAYVLLTPRKYQARMRVLVKHERADPVVGPDSSSPVVRREVSEADVNSEIELLTSNQTLQEVALRNRLGGAPPQGAADQAGGEALDRAVRRLRADLRVAAARRASVIEIDYASENPDQSVAVLKTLGEVYLDLHLRAHRTAGTQEFFKRQASDYEQQLAAAQERLAQARQRDNVVLLPEQKDLTIRRIMETEMAFNESGVAFAEASARVATLRNQLAALPARVVTQSRVLPNQYSVERLNTMLAELRNRRAELLVKFRPEDRLVRDLDEQIAETTGALTRAQTMTSVEETTDVNPLRQRLDQELAQAELTRSGLEARRTALATDLVEWRTRLRELDAATVEHDTLTREVKVIEDKAVLYVQKQEEARIADALDQQKIANVSIAEAPVRPYLPSEPNVPLNLILGFAVAVLASVGTGFALEVNRTTLETEDEIEAVTGLPVLATIPADGV